MSDLSAEDRRAMVAEAEAGRAAAWADVERRRVAGERPPVISEAKSRCRQHERWANPTPRAWARRKSGPAGVLGRWCAGGPSDRPELVVGPLTDPS